MNWVDAAVIAIIALSAMLAFARGFAREVLGIGAWVAAAAVAWWALPYLRPQVAGWGVDPGIVDPVAGGIGFIVALIFFSIIAGWAGSAIRMSLLGGLDRTLGMVFGIVRGAALVAVAYIGLGIAAPPERWPAPLQTARSLPFAYRGAVLLASLVPDQFRPAVRPLPPQPETRAEDLLQLQPQGRAVGQP